MEMTDEELMEAWQSGRLTITELDADERHRIIAALDPDPIEE
jgi:hypothetical protein